MAEFPSTTIKSRKVTLADYAIVRYQIDGVSPELRETSRTLSLEISAGDIAAVENEKACEILLDIAVGGAESPETKSYPLEMQLRGVFKASPRLSDETFLDDIANDGIQELYAIAKASLMELTAGSPAGRIILPSVLLNRE